MNFWPLSSNSPVTIPPGKVLRLLILEFLKIEV